jgi:gag-polypeptide of LTR copia-type
MDTNLRISLFSGEQKDWGIWSIQYLAKARLKGYRNLVTGVGLTPEKGTKGYEDFLLTNDIAFSELIIACASEVCVGNVDTSRSETLPEGDAKLAWKNLVAKFEPTTKANLIKIKKEFSESSLDGIETDPDQWIQGLEVMHRKLQILGHTLTEMDLIIHILYNLPEEYSTTVQMLENDLELDLAKLERFKEKLRIKFE